MKAEHAVPLNPNFFGVDSLYIVCDLDVYKRQTFYICWGAQAGLYHHFGINKSIMDEKLFGVYEHDIYNDRPLLLRGFDEKFWMPHSRHTTVSLQQIKEDVYKRQQLISVMIKFISSY